MKRMICLAVLALFSAATVSAQFVKTAEKQTNTGWQNLSFDTDGVYGAEIEKAYGMLGGKAVKKKVTVALIGTGIDFEHEDLAGSIWTNPKEKPNGRDDDKNGLVDDLHGWNFLGNAAGGVLDEISKEGDREFMRLKDKGNYARIFSDNPLYNDTTRYYAVNKETGAVDLIPRPANFEEYYYFRKMVVPGSTFAAEYLAENRGEITRVYTRDFDRKLRETYPGKELTVEDFKSILEQKPDEYFYGLSAFMISMSTQMTKTDKWDTIYDYIMNFLPRKDAERVEKLLAKTLLDDRKMVGDNLFDIKDRVYGNNTLLTENAGRGTMLAGIIGAVRGNGVGIDGVADNLQMMTLRVEADENGDIYLKDMALAIRYAVDHGADIIQMPKTNMIVNMIQRPWVDEALEYAQKKGVLIVQPGGENGINLDAAPSYPRKQLSERKLLSNMITVGASDEKGVPLINSDFGKRSLDIFAPGANIYSAYMGDTYRMETSPRLAAAMVTGVAALIKSRYPGLTAAQIREILIGSVTSREGAEVEISVAQIDGVKIQGTQNDLFDFSDLCVSGGILNAAKALSAAGKVSR